MPKRAECCSVCQVPRDSVRWGREKSTRCYVCYRNISNQRKKAAYHKGYAEKQKEREVKHWAKRLVMNAAARQKEFNLTAEWVLEQYEKQNGKCYWFRVTMQPSVESWNPFKPSLDRLDSSKGYTTDNVVLCSLGANLAKNQTTDTLFEKYTMEVRKNGGS